MLTISMVLEAREQRWLQKKELCRVLRAAHPDTSWSLAVCTLRMPAALRISDRYRSLVVVFQDELRKALMAKRIEILVLDTKQYSDGPSSWLAAACDASVLKRLAIGLEDEHSFGALIDIDIADSSGNLLSRRDIGYPARKCIVCSEDAAMCSAGQRHSFAEIADRVEQMIKK